MAVHREAVTALGSNTGSMIAVLDEIALLGFDKPMYSKTAALHGHAIPQHLQATYSMKAVLHGVASASQGSDTHTHIW